MLAYFFPRQSDLSVSELLDSGNHKPLFDLSQDKIPGDMETQLRLAKEVNGWNVKHNLFQAIGPLEIVLACLDDPEWITLIPKSSILKQCKHVEFAIKAFDLYPVFMISIPEIMHVLDQSVFTTEEFKSALESNPDVIFDLDDDGENFLERYKYWTIPALESIIDVVGEINFKSLYQKSTIEYTLDEPVREFLERYKEPLRRSARIEKLKKL